MMKLPALKVLQFNQELYMLNLSAVDVDRLVRFEVLGDTGVSGNGKARAAKRGSVVNWSEIERKVQTSEKAYQRPILRKKLSELATYYLQCRDDGQVPAIPGAVLLTTEQPVQFEAQGGNPFVGLLSLSGEDDSLRVLDGQHRLLALAGLLNAPDVAEADRAAARLLQVPAILFAALPPPSVVEMFVTINSKHTRLNPSLLFSLKGRQLYADPLDARIHDAIRELNGANGSPLKGQIKMLGTGPGKVAQAGVAQELRKTLMDIQAAHASAGWLGDFMSHLGRFYLLYFKEVSRVFEDAWASKQHSLQTLAALRAFIQASKPVIERVMEEGGDPRSTLRAMLAPWKNRIGAARFETAGLWRERAAGGGKETTRLLARELIANLGDVS